jgi:hypothetical protein
VWRRISTDCRLKKQNRAKQKAKSKKKGRKQRGDDGDKNGWKEHGERNQIEQR